MNERIRELWDKAATASAAFPSGQNNSWETQVNFMEKFAELIVQECIDTVSDCSVEYCTRPQVVSEIKEHFGVEE
jgi:hypothetical protein